MNLDQPPYRLMLNREPFTFALYHDAELLLPSQAHDEAMVDWQLSDREARITFRDAALSVTLTETAIDFRWQSKIRSQKSEIAFS